MDKTGRNGLRVGDILSPQFSAKYHALRNKHLNLLRLYPPLQNVPSLADLEAEWFESLEQLKGLQMVDTEIYINKALQAGKRVLAEGAQGSMLDIDFGTYPYVTSSNTITAGVCKGLGVPPSRIGEVIGITKAYCTRVGAGPFPTELLDETGEFLRKEGQEFGATTGRPRRCGWIDLPQLKYVIMLNGVTQLVITKIDILNSFETIEAATDYQYEGETHEMPPYDMSMVDIKPIYKTYNGWQQSLEGIRDYGDLPVQARAYLMALEDQLNTPISMVSTGPVREELILKEVEAIA